MNPDIYNKLLVAVPKDAVLSRRIDKDLLIDLGNGEYKYDGDLFLDGVGLTSLTEMPYNIIEITGIFSCDANKLTNLEGCPKVVGGDFYCSNNKLASLVGAPKEVGSGFYCDDNDGAITEEYVRSLCNVGGKVYV